MRSIFWNVKEAFVGLPMIKLLPSTFFLYPVALILPTYAAISFHKGNVKYNMYRLELL